jgi:hypothetical protein
VTVLRTGRNVGAVTSLDGGRPADEDPVRLSPPADPWLTEAQTSPLGDAASFPSYGEVPPPDSVPFAAATPVGIPPPDRPRPRRRTQQVVIVVFAVCALFVGGMLANDRLGDDDDVQGSAPTGAPTPSAGRPGSSAAVVAPVTSAAVRAPEVVYEVTASGSGNTGSVAYTDQDGDIIRRNGIPLPWRTTFPAGTQRKPLVIDAQRKGGGDAGPVTCTITVGGKVLAVTTNKGRYAAALCSG